MKILLIAPRYLPIFNKDNRGAIEKLEQIYLLFNQQTNDTFTVYSPKISSDNYDQKNVKNVTFRNIDLTSRKYKLKKYFYALKRCILRQKTSEVYIREIIKDLKKKNDLEKYNLIIFENGEQDIPLFKKLTNTKVRTVLHLHNDYVNNETKNSKKIIEACDEIWTVSDFLAKRVCEVKKIKTTTILNTFQSEEVKTNKKTISQLKEKYGYGKNKIFLYIGRLLEVKGIIELVDAFNKYNKENSNCKLLIIGATDGGRRGKKIENKLNKIQNSNIIRLGYLKPSELANYQTIASCQIVPSMWEEAFGLVILEAMASNTKIIASKSGGIPEVGKNKITYVERSNMVEELTKVMKKVDNNKKLPSGYYEEILKQFSKTNYCNRLHAAIHNEEK